MEVQPQTDEQQSADEVQPDLEAPANPADLVPELEPPSPSPQSRQPHPLQPGGRRFEQVYAQSKQAQRELEAEREKRIRAEAQLELLGRNPNIVQNTVSEEYTWEQLEGFIAAGRLTRAEAEEHREKVLAKRLAQQVKEEFTRDTRNVTREQHVVQGINGYVQAVPSVADVNSNERRRLDEEFDWLASVQGVDVTKMSPVDRKALELTALRNVFGPLEQLARKTQPVGSTQQELPGGTPPRRPTNPDQALLDSLSPAQIAHYNKMFRAGRYPNKWKDVVEELKFTPPRGR